MSTGAFVLLLAAVGISQLNASPIEDENTPMTDEMTFDPMTSSPQLTFNSTGRVADDLEEPDYVAIASTSDGSRLILLDSSNNKAKVMVTSSGTPRVTSYVTLPRRPWALALLPDGLIAVTTWWHGDMFLLRLQGDVISLESSFSTRRRYEGVEAGLDNGTLLVTSSSTLDVITYDGRVVEHLNVSVLLWPEYMCRAGGNDVFISDRTTLYRVNARTGEVLQTIRPPDMKYPHQITVDKGGNLYVASRGSYRIMVMSPVGEWRTLIGGSRGDLATGISVTSDDVIVTWAYVRRGMWSVISFYSMNEVN